MYPSIILHPGISPRRGCSFNIASGMPKCEAGESHHDGGIKLQLANAGISLLDVHHINALKVGIIEDCGSGRIEV